MTPREDHIFVIDFILSGRNPGELLAAKKIDAAVLIKKYINNGPPNSMAMTDPVMFTRLRNAITTLLLNGWG